MIKKEYEVTNIVATVSLDREINLDKLVRIVDGVDYEPEQFPGAILRIKNPKTTFLIFTTGKCVATGAKSVKELEQAIKIFKEKIASV